MESIIKRNQNISKYQLISMVLLAVSVGMTLLAMYEKFFAYGRGKMKSPLFYIKFCLICVIIMPVATMLYMRSGIITLNIIALIVNILAIPAVAFCLYKEKKNNSNK